MNRIGKSIIVGLAMLAMATLLAACGSSGTSASTSTAAKGVVKLDVTDAPSLDYAHVYITVTGIGFHTSSTTGFSDYSSGRRAGWQTVTLPAPKTIDLAQLANGTMYADLTGSSLFDGITLPVGRYQQLRIFLASTEDTLTDSASALGLTYNNEVQLNGDTAHYPLRVPSANTSGIKVIPESPVVVTEGSTVSLALDFNLSDDVVEVSPNGTVEFMLKPRLGYFDMGSVGAIKGAVSFSNLSTSRIEVKAEQVRTGARRMVRRTAAVDRTTGAFTLYPLPIFGNATTAVYDVVIRGRQVETAIVKGITVHKGTTPATGIDLGTIALQAGTDFTTQLSGSLHPTGSWMNFYQNVGGDLYEIRNQHLDPYTGKFHSGVDLSSGYVEVATYVPGSSLTFTTYSSTRGQYSMVANAFGNYTSGSPTMLNGRGRMSVSVTGNAPHSKDGSGSSSITGVFDDALLGTGMGHGMGGMMGGRKAQASSGQLFVVQDGMIVDSTGTLTGDSSVATAMNATNGSVSVGNLPSGMYSMYAIGWGNGVVEAGNAGSVNVGGGNARATIKMK
ncbi:DUF4382 domain-containing protein [Geomesophilobacter sediminis]|uniref:DUF4382 domain-containing protein n=1 Tax=Geomesophilobacter sediminis TaxID=2798584 RepID=A0A8J7J4M1_9BACT|nr:DUF4382 domain-containing protein [Geomesophilobacter sediminis]MBJ6723131.1 DUF4382 domain-containing protein [Geomesophilobacter sediminis]